MKILPVILSGGAGTRLWPLSRQAYPKQFQALCGKHSLLQQTVQRMQDHDDVLPPVVVCNEVQRFLVAEQLREAGILKVQIILEPMGKNTAPAIALPALRVDDPENTIMVVMSSDHFIDDDTAFQATISKAVQAAKEGHLMTIGIAPTKPHTGFGYIKKGDVLSGFEEAFAVTSFKEKPDAATAQSYLDDGGYLWNAGIFVLRADRYITELQQHDPSIVSACQKALSKGSTDQDFIRLDQDAFAQSPSISIDYAVMERSDKVGIVSASFSWSDVGGWNALHELGQKDAKQNVTQGDVILQNVHGAYVHSDSRLVTVVGLDDVVVVETSDAVLVSSKKHVDDVKEIVDHLNKLNRSEGITFK